MTVNTKKILVSQPKPTSDKSPYYDLAEKYGVEVVFRPFIKVEGLAAKEFRQQKINIADYTAVIMTSRTAIDNYFRLCEETRFNVPDSMKYFCTTEQVANYLQKYIIYRKRKIFHAQTGHMEDLVPLINKHPKEKYLLPASDVHQTNMAVLEATKADITTATMYRTVSNDFRPDEAFDYDMLIFFSPSGIESLLKNFPDFKQGDIKIGCLGSSAQKAVEAAGLRLDIAAPTPEAPSMTAAIDLFLAAQKKRK